ncbi:MAG TPA: 4Fe-4S double cluster binding domain-containing protein, partial [Elusimicrobiales bacterium]|nr:4Fe-4S double cluster binding domain-containing protein [Elusimicrobiales bacterium]
IDIKNWYPEAKSVLICTFNYWNSTLGEKRLYLKGSQVSKLLKIRHRKPSNEYKNNPNHVYKVTRYSMPMPYQKEIKVILKEMLAEFKQIDPAINGKAFVDTSPVMEKPLAIKAGLGFRGKNAIVVNPDIGSFFFIGGIALNIALDSDEPKKFKGCGSCNLCVKACPTKALSEYKLDISKCITAWNYVKMQGIPPFIKKHRKTLALACDICQEVCPYNKKTDTPIVKQLEPVTIK